VGFTRLLSNRNTEWHDSQGIIIGFILSVYPEIYILYRNNLNNLDYVG